MAKRRQSGSEGARRHGVAAFLLLLLPAFAFLGVLAPGAVTVQYEEEEEFDRGRSVPFRPVRLSRRPLLVPRDYSAGFVPELLDLEMLFTGSDYRADVTQRIARMPSFPSSQGDVIVLDDTDAPVDDSLFKDVLSPSFVADATSIHKEVIPPLDGRDGLSQFDDFAGTGPGEPQQEPIQPVVPEPGTGLLVSGGCFWLAVRARRQRQPATS